jgi:outer membrane protein TolC
VSSLPSARRPLRRRLEQLGFSSLLGVGVGVALGLAPTHAQAQDAAAAPEVPRDLPESQPLPVLEPLPARGSLSLARAVETLGTSSRDLEMASGSIEQARLLRDQARAVLLPSANLSGSYTLRDQEVAPYLDSVYENDPDLQQFFVDNPSVPDARNLAAATSEPIVVQNRHDFRFDLTLRQTLFDARALVYLDQAATALEQAELNREQVRYRLEGALQALYFDALALRRLIDISAGNFELARISAERARAAYELEVGARFDANRATVSAQTAQREYERAVLSYELALEALRAYLRLDDVQDVETPPTLDPPESLEALIESALENRQELAASALALRSVDERLDENRAGWWPSFSAQAQASVVRESAFTGDAFSWNLGVFMNWDLWDGGLRLAQRDTIEIDRYNAELAADAQADAIVSELRSAWLRYETQARVLPSIRAEAELAERNNWLTREAQDLGAASALEVEISQEQLFLARIALADAEVTLQEIIYELYRLAGLI